MPLCPHPPALRLAHSAPATLPFFLFLKMAKHIPGLKPVPWGDSPSSCNSFPYFLQVSAQNKPTSAVRLSLTTACPSSSPCFIFLHSLSPLAHYTFSSAPSTANIISLRTGTNKYLAHIRLSIHQTWVNKSLNRKTHPRPQSYSSGKSWEHVPVSASFSHSTVHPFSLMPHALSFYSHHHLQRGSLLVMPHSADKRFCTFFPLTV